MPRFRAIHTIELKPDVEGELFEDFMLREFLPAIRALPGCLGVELLKGYQGDLDGVAHAESDYGWLTLWESVEANNAAWSKEGIHHTPDQIQKDQIPSCITMPPTIRWSADLRFHPRSNPFWQAGIKRLNEDIEGPDCDRDFFSFRYPLS